MVKRGAAVDPGGASLDAGIQTLGAIVHPLANLFLGQTPFLQDFTKRFHDLVCQHGMGAGVADLDREPGQRQEDAPGAPRVVVGRTLAGLPLDRRIHQSVVQPAAQGEEPVAEGGGAAVDGAMGAPEPRAPGGVVGCCRGEPEAVGPLREIQIHGWSAAR
jgi:hypothetical protein